MKPVITALAVIGARTRALGMYNKLIWDIPDDLKRFHKMTKGKTIIMGRKTFESIGHPLPNRTNIVITRNTSLSHDGIIIKNSFKEALEYAKQVEPEEICVIGGAEIYTQALPYVDRLYLTLVDSDSPGDVFFPDYRMFVHEIDREEHEHNGLHYAYVTLKR